MTFGSSCAANGLLRVFESVCGVIERRLRLKVNREKSSIRHAAQATLLGFGFFSPARRSGSGSPPRRSSG